MMLDENVLNKYLVEIRGFDTVIVLIIGTKVIDWENPVLQSSAI